MPVAVGASTNVPQSRYHGCSSRPSNAAASSAYPIERANGRRRTVPSRYPMTHSAAVSAVTAPLAKRSSYEEADTTGASTSPITLAAANGVRVPN
jgi:hypothetical protein